MRTQVVPTSQHMPMAEMQDASWPHIVTPPHTLPAGSTGLEHSSAAFFGFRAGEGGGLLLDVVLAYTRGGGCLPRTAAFGGRGRAGATGGGDCLPEPTRTRVAPLVSPLPLLVLLVFPLLVAPLL